MSILDSSGRPMGLSTDQLAKAFQNDMSQMIQMMNVIQQGLMLSELKTNFLIKKLTEAEILGDELNTEWEAFFKEKMSEMQKQLEAKELTVVGDASKIVGNPNALFDV